MSYDMQSVQNKTESACHSIIYHATNITCKGKGIGRLKDVLNLNAQNVRTTYEITDFIKEFRRRK